MKEEQRLFLLILLALLVREGAFQSGNCTNLAGACYGWTPDGVVAINSCCPQAKSGPMINLMNTQKPCSCVSNSAGTYVSDCTTCYQVANVTGLNYTAPKDSILVIFYNDSTQSCRGGTAYVNATYPNNPSICQNGSSSGGLFVPGNSFGPLNPNPTYFTLQCTNGQLHIVNCPDPACQSPYCSKVPIQPEGYCFSTSGASDGTYFCSNGRYHLHLGLFF
jgi:hypothetical protein